MFRGHDIMQMNFHLSHFPKFIVFFASYAQIFGMHSMILPLGVSAVQMGPHFINKIKVLIKNLLQGKSSGKIKSKNAQFSQIQQSFTIRDCVACKVISLFLNVYRIINLDNKDIVHN